MKRIDRSVQAHLGLLLLSCLWGFPSTATADTLEWAAPVDERFEGASNWSPVGVPDADDVAQFSVSSSPSYQVIIGSSPTIDKLIVDGGTPILIGSSGQRTLTITDDGGVTDEDILVIGGGSLDILSQVDVVASDGFLSVGNNGHGLLNVEGATASLTVNGTGRSHFIGGRGAVGQLVVSDDAAASFGFNAGSEGTLEVGVSSFNATRGLVNVIGGGTLNAGKLNVATSTTGATGFVTVQDSGSTVNLLADLTIGSSTGGAGMLEIQNNATFNTGTGTTTINPTGTVNVGLLGNGLFNANGAVNIVGGALDVGDSDDFDLAAGLTLTASNGGQVGFNNDYTIDNGTTFEINSGADLTATRLDIGASGQGDGTLIVDGAGSTVTVTGPFSIWRKGSASVTFSNQASGSFGSILFSTSGIQEESVTNLLVETGADVTMDDLDFDFFGIRTGIFTIDGAGSTLIQTGASILTIGNVSGHDDQATINVQNSGEFITGTGLTSINNSGTLNVGVTGNGKFVANGRVEVTRGKLNVGSGANDFDLAADQVLFASIGGQVSFNGSYSIDDGTTFRINSGADLSTAGLLNIGTSGDGTLFADGAGSTVTAGGASSWGLNGDAADVAFRNQATGSFPGISLADSIFDATTGNLVIVTDADMTTGNLSIATMSSGAAGALTVHGDGSTLTQTGGSTLTVGSASGTGSATINIDDGGEFTTGTGVTTIHATGTVAVSDGGKFNAHGPVNIDGGTLTVEMSNGLVLPAGQTLTASGGAQVAFNGSYYIYGGTTFEINSGADLLVNSSLDIGALGASGSGNSTLIADGAGTAVTVGDTSFWGLTGTTTEVTFRNQATGDLTSVRLADSINDLAVGNLFIETGADVTAGSLRIATLGSSATGTITIDGDGSTLTQPVSVTPLSIFVGSASGTGSATLNIQNGGSVTVGTGTTRINATGTINVGITGDGIYNANSPVVINGGTFNVGGFDDLNLAAGQKLTASHGGQANFVGGYAINSGTDFEINSGSKLSATGLDIGDFGGDGTLIVDGAGSTVTVSGASHWGSGSTASITFRNQAVGNFGLIGLADTSTSNSGGNVSIETGATVMISRLSIATANSDATASITVDGVGSTLSLSLLRVGSSSGTGSATVHVRNGGTLTTGTDATTIDATGTINLQRGALHATTIDHTRGGQFNFTGGRLSVDTFQGDLVNGGGTLAPGTSPGSTTIIGDYTQQVGASLEIELSGTLQGTEFDFVNGTGIASIAGDLELALIDGFMPQATDEFIILSSNVLVGSFDNVASGTRLDTTDGLGSFVVALDFATDQIVLSDFLLAPGLPGDYNNDGIVDAADYSVWRDNLGAADESALNGNGDGMNGVDTADYQLWRTNFGAMAPAAIAVSQGAVPEPATLVLLVLSIQAISICRHAAPRFA